MDENVIQAMQRWPDVPAAAGWLSLDARGAWRLHEHGGANQGEPGARIAHDGLIAFICRNYGRDAQGRWFFQNGPQRVYVTLAAAPYVLRWNASQETLENQLGVAAGPIATWWLDSSGALYAETPVGPARVDDRDLEHTAQRLHLPDGRNLLDAWQNPDHNTAQDIYPDIPAGQAAFNILTDICLDGQASVPLMGIGAQVLPAQLGFERLPSI